MSRIAFSWLGPSVVAATLVLAAPCSLAQGRSGVSLIRDAETEHTIREFVTPVFEAADLDPQSIEINLIGDSSLNAFVAGGQRIFINTGLIQKVRNPNELIGVIAHETGHIAGGHLARIQDELRSATTQSIVGMLLGLVTMVGSPAAGQAIMMGSSQVATRNLLQYSRTQESAADQAGLTFLERTGQSGRGLESFLEVIGGQESLLASRQDPYMRTHPVTSERIAALRTRIQQSKSRDAVDLPEYVKRLKLIQAKLYGFMEPLGSVMQKYPETDTSIPARYARAIAWYRIPDLNRALPAIDKLIAERPSDPYFFELKAQMLFENGRVQEALEPSETAVKLLGNEPLLRLALGQIQVALDKPDLYKQAIGNLETASRADRDNVAIWQQLAIAYGRDGNLGMASYASAERFLLQGKKRDARGQATVALRLLPAGTPGWLRAQDIMVATEKDEDKDGPQRRR